MEDQVLSTLSDSKSHRNGRMTILLSISGDVFCEKYRSIIAINQLEDRGCEVEGLRGLQVQGEEWVRGPGAAGGSHRDPQRREHGRRGHQARDGGHLQEATQTLLSPLEVYKKENNYFWLVFWKLIIGSQQNIRIRFKMFSERRKKNGIDFLCLDKALAFTNP